MKLLSFLDLRGIGGQIAALVVVSIVTLHLIVTALFLMHRPDQPDPSFERGPDQLAAAAQLLGTASPSDRSRLVTDLVRAFPQLDIALVASDAAPRASDA